MELQKELDPATGQEMIQLSENGCVIGGIYPHPEGIRIGVQEMTRFGMGEEEMVRIAELIKECIIENKSVKEEVNRLRSEYQEVKCSFDELVRRKPELVEIKAT